MSLQAGGGGPSYSSVAFVAAFVKLQHFPHHHIDTPKPHSTTPPPRCRERRRLAHLYGSAKPCLEALDLCLKSCRKGRTSAMVRSPTWYSATTAPQHAGGARRKHGEDADKQHTGVARPSELLRSSRRAKPPTPTPPSTLLPRQAPATADETPPADSRVRNRDTDSLSKMHVVQSV